MQKSWVFCVLFIIVELLVFFRAVPVVIAEEIHQDCLVFNPYDPHADTICQKYAELKGEQEESDSGILKTPNVIKGKIIGQITEGNAPYFKKDELKLDFFPFREVWVANENGADYSDENGNYELYTSNVKGEIEARLRSQDFEVFEYNYFEPAYKPNEPDTCKFKRDYLICYFTNHISRVKYDINKAINYYIDFGHDDMEDVAASNTYHYTQMTYDLFRQEQPSHALFSLRAIVNIPSSCNAFYYPSVKTTYYLIEEGGNGYYNCPNTAYSTVIAHETGHAILDSILGWPAPGKYPTTQDFYSYHEGVADTVSALTLDEPCIGENLFNSTSGCLRDMRIDVKYGPFSNFPNNHEHGRVLGSTFWDLREEIGINKTRTIFYEFIQINEYGLHPNMTQYVLEADKIHFNGEHEEIIKEVFKKHRLY